MICIKPARGYEKSYGSYRGSSIEISLTCACHSATWGGLAKRTGLTWEEEWPVYELCPTNHQEYRGMLVALDPDGQFIPRDTDGEGGPHA